MGDVAWPGWGGGGTRLKLDTPPPVALLLLRGLLGTFFLQKNVGFIHIHCKKIIGYTQLCDVDFGIKEALRKSLAADTKKPDVQRKYVV